MPGDVASVPNLLAFWDFQLRHGSGDLTSVGAHAYTLEEMNGPIDRADVGVFGPRCLRFELGQWLRIPRGVCTGLVRAGRDPISVVAWIQRRTDNEWQFIAGMWDERHERRQYALFTSGHKQAGWRDLARADARHQPHGYVSDVGGATPGQPFCFSYATGAQPVPTDRWTTVGFTYDHHDIRVYTDGRLDANGDHNPFRWDRPIFDPGHDGADFTVAQRDVPSWPTYPHGRPERNVGFGGLMGGLAVFGRALSAEEMRSLHEAGRR